MKELHKALLKVQQEIGTFPKDKQGNFGPYASLEIILSTSEPILHKHGLLLNQPCEVVNGQNVLTTVITHVETGQEKRSSLILVTDKPGPQGLGSSLTYLKRYEALGILGKASEDDPDSATQKPQQTNHGANRTVSTASKPVGKKEYPLKDQFVANGLQFKGAKYGQVPLADLMAHADKVRRKPAGDRNKYEEKFLSDVALLQMEHEMDAEIIPGPPVGRFDDSEIPF